MNAVRTFVDTNILIYAFTTDESMKRELAVDVLENCVPVLSIQVLKEFTNVLVRKTEMEATDIGNLIREIMGVSEIAIEKTELIHSALKICDKYGYSFYDSYIIATAIDSKCQILLSEDMQNGQIIENRLTVKNPF
jgi:predicted nucleic acid-binding protein